MQLTFESLAELQDFVQWIGALTPIKTVTVGDVSVSAPAADPIFREVLQTMADAVEDLPEPEALVGVDGEVARTEATEANKPARKRRTKAEMEAARAAAPDLKDEMEAARTATQDAVAGILEAAGETPEAAKEMAAVAVDLGDMPTVAVARANTPDSMQDAISFIKSRLTERPEVSQVEHLNLARTFIGKHGMEKYNTSFPLAGLTPNVMGYSPADCATHAAALDFLSLE